MACFICPRCGYRECRWNGKECPICGFRIDEVEESNKRIESE